MQQFVYNAKEEFHKYRNVVFVLFVFCMMVVLSFFATRNMDTSSAANLNNFNPANIISDAVMGNYNSMSVSDIQNFLDSKNSCDNRDYNLYLQYKAAHPSINWHWEGEPYNGHFVCMAEERFGDGEVIGSGMTAAEIIYDAAQQNHINPQVLLVLLQKESSLITDKVPNSHDYRQATGYGCPDTAACDAKYYGFKNQIYRAAELFRYTLDHGYSLYPVGVNVYVGYHPSSSCGGASIKIENRATAALYRYTPYQPNQAALDAGYGVGNACSAYGNRNFYLYFTDWFGSTQAAVDGELIVIPDGEYNLTSAVGKQRVLAINDTNAEIAELDVDSEAARFTLQRDEKTGYYQITNTNTKQPLMVHSKTPEQGSNIIAGASTTCAKWWKIYQTKDNYLTFESTCETGMVLDVQGGSSKAGTNVHLWLTHGGASQKWQLTRAKTITDGLYVIQPTADETLALDVYGGYPDNGTNVQLWTKHAEGSQRWYAEYHADGGYYTLTNPNSGKLFDLNAAKAKDGQNLQIWISSNSCAQRWYIATNEQGYNIISTCAESFVVDTRNGKLAASQNVQLAGFANTESQNWQFVAANPVLVDGTYVIQTAISEDKAIDVYGAYTSNGTNIELYDYHGGAAQQWQVMYNEKTDDYSLKNPNSGKYLDVYGGYMRAGENIQLWPGNLDCNQRWRIQKNGLDTYSLRSACTNDKSLDLYGGYLQNRTNIQLWDSHNGPSQKWRFVEVE